MGTLSHGECLMLSTEFSGEQDRYSKVPHSQESTLKVKSTVYTLKFGLAIFAVCIILAFVLSYGVPAGMNISTNSIAAQNRVKLGQREVGIQGNNIISGYLEFLGFSGKSRTYHYLLTKRERQSPLNSQDHTSCLILWINGGLGTSSYLGYYSSIGPLVYDQNSDSFQQNADRWNTLCDLLIVDQPMGTGLSNKHNQDASQPDLQNELPSSYNEMAQDLKAFVTLFVEGTHYKDLHITGESLAGKIILRFAKFYLEQPKLDDTNTATN